MHGGGGPIRCGPQLCDSRCLRCREESCPEATQGWHNREPLQTLGPSGGFVKFVMVLQVSCGGLQSQWGPRLSSGSTHHNPSGHAGSYAASLKRVQMLQSAASLP